MLNTRFIRYKIYKILFVLFNPKNKKSKTWIFCFFTELNKNPVEGFSAGLIDDNDIFRWEVLIIGPPDTL